jgi:maltose/maltodextrin transport system substrate-binding protein
MIKKLFLAVFIFLSASRAFSWTEGELLLWVSDNRGFRSWVELGKKFEQEMGVPVRVETQEGITEKFQAAAQGGKGPDIFMWAHDRIGEWADGGLLKPLEIKEDFKAAFIPMSWDAVTHNQQTWGYPLALECVSLIYNKKLVNGKPPAQLSEYPAFAKELKAKDPKLMAIMWDYKTPTLAFRSLPALGLILLGELRAVMTSRTSASTMPAPSRV